jgi:sodium-dependent dicarboxylate transporter 2/3/5
MNEKAPHTTAFIKTTILVVNLIAFFSILYFSPFEPALAKGLAIFVFVAVLWITEVFHVSVTSLLVPVLAALLGVFDVNTALIKFSHPIIFLFMGGFALAAAMHKHQLDQFISFKLIKLAKGNMLFSSFLVFGLTAFSSMFISNTATIAMMMPLVLGLLTKLNYKEHKSTYLYFLLGTAYSGSIGGMGTLVGSPPNAIAASAINIGFTEWIIFGVPMVLISLPVMVAVLYLILRPKIHDRIQIPEVEFVMTPSSWKVAVIFLSTVLCWVFSRPISNVLGVESNFDALVAISAIIALSTLKVVTWKELANSTDWGVLILFGGGITLSSILKVTGTSLYLAEGVRYLVQDAPLLLFMLITIAFVVFLTELVSNTASTALLVPIFISVADSISISSSIIAIIIALAASCAFMLPVATPPNAIVFGTGYVPQKSMMRVGLILNMVLIALITALAIIFI